MADLIKSVSVTLVVAATVLIAWANPEVAPLLEYDSSYTLFEQPLQVIACHLLHWTSEHLFWDLLMFVILGAICERISRSSYVSVLVASAVLIPPIVSTFYPAIESYRGLSGIDTALFAMATVWIGIERYQARDKSGVWTNFGLLAAMFFKMGHELISGNTFFVESDNFMPVPIAHVVGAAAGIAAGLWAARTLGRNTRAGWRRANGGSVGLHS